MTAAPNSRRLACLLAVLLCIVLAGWAGMQLADRLAEARSITLLEAANAVDTTAAPLVDQQAVSPRLVAGVEGLLAQPALGLNYLTLHNANGVTLVSRGRLGHALAWLPDEQAQSWRSFFYRLGAAEMSRSLSRAGRTVGTMRLGVGWGHVAQHAGMPLLTWCALLAAALAGLYASILRWRAAPTPVSAPAEKKPRAEKRVRTPRLSLSRMRPRAPGRNSEFAPISASYGSHRQSEPALAESTAPAQAAPEPVSPASPPIAEDAPADEPSEPTTTADDTPIDEKPVAPVARARPEQRSASAQTIIAPRPTNAGAKTVRDETPSATVAERAGAQEFHAPRVDAEPELGDSTLDLRFYPIWRGIERKILAGAWAALAWRSGDTELVDAETLTRMAEKEGALRALTQWIARRFSVLHGNWRTLELNTVPILLPIPSAMLAFADAEAVWRDALRRTDRDTNDLILRLDPLTGDQTQAALPVRRALPLERADAALPPDCDVLCVRPDQLNGDIDTWRNCFASASRPVLFGPIAKPADWSALIEHERVSWFSTAAENLHTPRSFARLLTRYRTEPV